MISLRNPSLENCSTDPIRSRIMRAVRQKDTGPETIVRRILHGLGLRFRLHRKDLPGTPDIVLAKHKTVVFVHGCFWHRHRGCSKTTTPKTRKEFWKTKFDQNVERDLRIERALFDRGWNVLVIWGCETNDLIRLRKRLSNEFTSDGEEAHGRPYPRNDPLQSVHSDLREMAMAQALPELEAFLDLYRRLEYALKRTDFLDKERKRASANWVSFAEELGESFFAEMRDAGEATTLITEPPRAPMRDSMAFEPTVQEPITNVVELFTRGVCQVRHNYEHGEKRFTDESFARDATLVREALRVLECAVGRLERVSYLMEAASGSD